MSLPYNMFVKVSVKRLREKEQKLPVREWTESEVKIVIVAKQVLSRVEKHIPFTTEFYMHQG